MEDSLLQLAGIILLSFTVGTIAGFGNVIIALTLGSHLYAIDELLPLLVILSTLLTSYIVIRYRSEVDWGALTRRIVPPMIVGLGIGLIAFHNTQSPQLRTLLGILVVALSGRELWSLRTIDAPDRTLSTPVQRGVLLSAGVLHGIFATGGPLLVYALGRAPMPKETFRATLSCVWLVLNGLLLTTYAATGRVDTEVIMRVITLLPILLVAVVLGEWGHRRIAQRPFKIVVFSVLLLAGAALLV